MTTPQRPSKVVPGTSPETSLDPSGPSGVIIPKEQGRRGLRGYSAYDIAVQNDFVGTEEEWLASLVGEPGAGGIMSDADPQSLGVATPGVSEESSRADHVHAMPSAADVGADAAGTAEGLVNDHAGADDPHGDRAYADGAFAPLAHDHDATYAPLAHNHDESYLASASIGVPNGIAELDENGTVPSAQLPSYVDDVVEVADYAGLSGVVTLSGRIYVTIDDGKTYRWSGTAFVEISASLALGETVATAYRGDRGKTAYDHSQITTGNPHGTTTTDIGAVPTSRTINGYDLSANRMLTASDVGAATSGHNHDGTYQPYGYGSVGLNWIAGAPVVSGTWTYGTTLNLDWYGVTAQNSYAEWAYVPLGGTYTLNVSGIEASTYGIITVAIDGVTVGTIDCYAGSSAAKVWSVSGIVVTPGMHTVRFSNPTKNASSTGYNLRVNSVAFNRTA